MPSLRVLLVEDSEDDATLIVRELRHAGYELAVVEGVATADGLRAALARQPWDLITCDDTLPELSALAALALIRAHDSNVPIVVVSRQVGAELAAALIRAGADDLVLKHNIQRLPQAVEQAWRDAANRRRISSAQQAATDATARQLQAIFEASVDVISILEGDGTLRDASPSTRSLLGYEVSDLVGRHGFDLVHPDDRAALQAEFARGMAEPAEPVDPTPTEYRVQHANGSSVYVESTLSNLLDDPDVRGFVLITRDITERKRTEEALRETHASLEIAVAAARAGVWDWDLRTGVTHYSESWRNLFGYSAADFDGSPEAWAQLVHPEDLERLARSIRATIENPASSYEEEFRLRHKDGTERWVLSRATVLLDAAGIPLRMLGVHVDISERKQAFAARLLDVREAESARIAREIHDLLGQGLTALRMDTAWLETWLSSRRNGCADEPVHKRLRAMAGLIEATIGSVRRIATELRPPILDDLGLVPTIEWQAEEFEARSGIRCEFRAWPGIPALDPTRSIVVLRVLQEALTNVARHAEATRVVIHASAEPGLLVCLEVRDNGSGIREHQINATESLGLWSMRERAALVGGTVAIKGAPGRGTTVTLRVPEGQSPTPDKGALGSRDRSGAE